MTVSIVVVGGVLTSKTVPVSALSTLQYPYSGSNDADASHGHKPTANREGSLHLLERRISLYLYRELTQILRVILLGAGGGHL